MAWQDDRWCCHALQNVECIATFDDSLGEIKNGAIYVEANVITWVGKTAELPKQYSNADCELDLSNRVMIPGMVSAV